MAEGDRTEAISLILRQLTRRIGDIPDPAKAKIEFLLLADLEDLGEALLDFTNVTDLKAWLEAR